MTDMPRPPIIPPPRVWHGVYRLPFAILHLAAFFVFSGGIGLEIHNKFVLAFTGVVQPAEVTDQFIVSGDDSDSHYLRLQYRVIMPNANTEIFQERVEVNSSVYFAHPIGSQIEIRYDPNNPSRLGLERNFTIWGWLRSAGIFVVVFAITVILLGLTLSFWRSAWRFLEGGVYVWLLGSTDTGYVVDAWQLKDKDGNQISVLAVSLTTPDGKWEFGQPVSQKHYERYKMGGPIQVRYHPQKKQFAQLLF